jgi:hypothetical protein
VHDGEPSGLDYIEKILQIPYRVRPIEPKGLDTYLHSQMELVEEAPITQTPSSDKPPVGEEGQTENDEMREKTTQTPDTGELQKKNVQVEEASKPPPPLRKPEPVERELPPEIVKFTREDFLDVKACCSQVNLTPRSVKRLVNVLKLMEIYWFRTLYHDRDRDIKQSVIALMVLAAAYPEVMVEVFARMEPTFENKELNQQTLGDYLGTLDPGILHRSDRAQAVVKWQLERFKEEIIALRKLQVTESDPPMNFLSPSFDNFGLSTFNLTRSFSFIGDRSYVLDDEKQETTT